MEPHQELKSLINIVERELSRCYIAMEEFRKSEAESAEDSVEIDYSFINTLSSALAFIALLISKLENVVGDSGINPLLVKSKIESYKDLSSSLKACLYARSTKMRCKWAGGNIE